MWATDLSVLFIILRTTIVYAVVLIGFRVIGKREAGQMTPFDLVLLLLIANAVQNAMTGPDTTITGGVIATMTLLSLNWLMNRLVWKNTRVRRLIEGSPTLLINNGKTIQSHLRAENITSDVLQEALREHGVEHIEDVKLAVLEIDGSISVLRNDEMPEHHRSHHNFRFLSHKNQ